MSKQTKQVELPEWEKEFEDKFLHGMEIHVSKPYSQMALERQFANEQIRWFKKLLAQAQQEAEKRGAKKENKRLISLLHGISPRQAYQQIDSIVEDWKKKGEWENLTNQS